ncbi:MAG: hypothetical protein PHX60_00510 [Giesbergeria sp.]|uniref:hypothetical protein n=1 Tax=Giesbergeria sp. TaxID=2818473 RepID=UPI002637E55D|nr:hypothetical protein [Giesbergeria sp.]MDD2608163.1 hypothetical protein [Giesbergeria sp.]
MKKINKYLLKISLAAGLTATGLAHAEFLSLHQFPLVYNIGSSLDASGQLVFRTTSPLIGFKDQYNPTATGAGGVIPCVMGYPEFRDKCQTVDGGAGFIINGYSSYPEFKIYIPAGTTFFGASGYLPQSAEYAVAVKLGSPPTRTTALTAEEYQTNKSTQNRFTDFNLLLAGQEKIFVHDGSGAISLSGIARLSSPLTTGKWLYIRAINQASVKNLGAIYEVNHDQYRTAYNALTPSFGADGDPVEEGTIPVGPTLTAIMLSPSTWKIGTNSGSITVTPVGTNNPALPANCSSNSPLVTLSQPSDGQTAKFSVTGTVATETPVKITCGDKEETLTLQPADPNAAQILDNVPSADTAGNLVINFKLKRPDTELVATNKTNFWIAALLPKTSFPYMNDEEEWFFFTPTGWMQQNSPNPLSVAYKINQTPTTAETSFRIPTGLPQAIAEYFNAELYFGYMGADGAFKNMGIIWKKN